jgi:hypothetical protein
MRATDAEATIAMTRGLFRSGDFSDLTVTVEGAALKLHKCVLNSCDYFKGMLSSQCQEAATGEVELKVAESSSAAATLLALEWIYTHDVEIDGESVMEVLATADKLQLQTLKTQCVTYLEQHVCASNACTILRASQQLGFSKLEEQCQEFIVHNSEAVFQGEGVKHLPKDTLLSMMQGDELDVEEEVVFDAVLEWCETN